MMMMCVCVLRFEMFALAPVLPAAHRDYSLRLPAWWSRVHLAAQSFAPLAPSTL